jgi:hypothetical protein
MPYYTLKVKLHRRRYITCGVSSNPGTLHHYAAALFGNGAYHLIERLTAAEAKQKRQQPPQTAATS